MASGSHNEDEILELDITNSSLEPITDTSRIDEDLSCIDDEMLLLSSPSPPASRDQSFTSGKGYVIAPPDNYGAKSRVKISKLSDINDEDDELQIIGGSFAHDMGKLSNTGNVCATGVVEGDGDSEDSDESEDSVSLMNGKINIFYCHGALLLWNADDVHMLREECRIVGKLTGSLPRAPQQNNHLGLPLQLMPEEAKLLVDIDAAVVVKEQTVPEKTLQVREAAFSNVRKTNFQIQQNLYKENRKEEVSQRLDDIKAGKKAKKRKLHEEGDGRVSKESHLSEPAKENMAEVGSSKVVAENVKGKTEDENCGDDADKNSKDVDEDDGNDDDKEDVDQLTVDDIVAKTGEISEKHSLVQIFTENPWKRTLSPYSDWYYPADRDLLRYLVFKDLWGKGFFLTSGAKFGGDYLVYPGDPARYHSHYIAICKYQHEELPCLDIISMGRLASNVRKTALLCTVDKNRKVVYTSLQWTGIS